MGELYLVRYAHASLGKDDCEKLFDLGYQQSTALGKAVAKKAVFQDRWIRGDMLGHRVTLGGAAVGMGKKNIKPAFHRGLNEFSSTGLLNASYNGKPIAKDPSTDRKIYFKELGEGVDNWQKNKKENLQKKWAEFTKSVNDVKKYSCAQKAKTALAMSSSGEISQLVASTLKTQTIQQTRLQLLRKKRSATKFIFPEQTFCIYGFNETPFITAENKRFLT